MRLLLILLTGVFMSVEAKAETAIFAGGCFWCIESDFDKLKGITSTVSGYIGGSAENASYKQVSHGNTAHYEAVKITFDPALVSYNELLDYFWRHIDPFDSIGQFCDKGDQYRAAIFFSNENQNKLAIASKTKIESKLGKSVVTQLIAADAFYDAEDYHQNYHNTNPTSYKLYRWSCGRDKRLKSVWGGI